MATGPAAALQSTEAPGPQNLWSLALRKLQLPPERETAREQVPEHSNRGYNWKVSNRVQICFAQGTCLLKDFLGIEMEASQETYCTSASNATVGRRGQWGTCAGRWPVDLNIEPVLW